MGQWIPENHLAIVGRAKDMIISGGLNIYPGKSKTISTPSPAWWNRRWSAYPIRISARPCWPWWWPAPGHTLSEAAIIAQLKDEIARFKVPKRVVFAVDLPRNAMGKVQKNELRKNFVTAPS